MFGRFAQQGNFRELFNLKESYLTLTGRTLILASYILVKPNRGTFGLR